MYRVWAFCFRTSECPPVLTAHTNRDHTWRRAQFRVMRAKRHTERCQSVSAASLDDVIGTHRRRALPVRSPWWLDTENGSRRTIVCSARKLTPIRCLLLRRSVGRIGHEESLNSASYSGINWFYQERRQLTERWPQQFWIVHSSSQYYLQRNCLPALNFTIKNRRIKRISIIKCVMNFTLLIDLLSGCTNASSRLITDPQRLSGCTHIGPAVVRMLS